MSEHSSDHGHVANSAVLFSEAEIQAFHEDDGRSATGVVCLMAGIFTIGLCLYIGVCVWMLE
jgi:uncharacterized membrane protein